MGKLHEIKQELPPVLTVPEMDHLRWVNLRLQTELLREQATVLTERANTHAILADGLMNELHQRLAQGSTERYEPRIVEGQLQFHLKPEESPKG